MCDRDWRILREDFSIATKGGNIPRPLRYWTESIISDGILKLIEKAEYKDRCPFRGTRFRSGCKIGTLSASPRQDWERRKTNPTTTNKLTALFSAKNSDGRIYAKCAFCGK